jgi:hypothetical protein
MNQQLPATIDEDGEIIVPEADISLAIGLTRAEVDQQITTARRFPRSIKRATDEILSLVTLDEITAKECTYALPRGGKPIAGPSIRMAEIVQQQWGNNRVASRTVHVDRTEKFVEAEGVYHDLETNSASIARVRRRIVDSNGRLYSDDMIIVTGNAAASIAKRNAILAGVPKPVWRKAYDAALHVIAGDIKTLTVRREAALKAFAAFGVKPEQVYTALGVAGAEDIGIDLMPVLIGMHSALKNGESTVEEMFNPKTVGKQPLDHNPLIAEKKTTETSAAAALPADGAGASVTSPVPDTPARPEIEIPDAFAMGAEAKRSGKGEEPPAELSGDLFAAHRDAFKEGYAGEMV